MFQSDNTPKLTITKSLHLSKFNFSSKYFWYLGWLYSPSELIGLLNVTNTRVLYITWDFKVHCNSYDLKYKPLWYNLNVKSRTYKRLKLVHHIETVITALRCVHGNRKSHITYEITIRVYSSQFHLHKWSRKSFDGITTYHPNVRDWPSIFIKDQRA